MSVFNEQGFEKKLLALKDSQESISTLSDWCLQNKTHHKKIVSSWLSVLKKVRVENRLTLFYLANDVIQYSKRKNYDYVESWATALQKATTMVRHDKVMDRIMRIFKIWGDRNVYSEEFLTDLRGLLTAKKATPATPQSKPSEAHQSTSTSSGEFNPSNLFNRMYKCKDLEDDTDLKLRKVNDCKHVNLNDLDAFRAMMKDRKHADGVAGQLDEAIQQVESYKRALEVEIIERKAVIDLLQQAVKFYETEKSDAKVVFNAYRNFGSRVKSLKRKLDDLVPSLSSPVPSPDVNAPSPSPDSDIDLPNDEDLSGKPTLSIRKELSVSQSADLDNMPNCFSSFMGSGSLPFDIQSNLFSDDGSRRAEISGLLEGEPEGKPIEVIGRRKGEDNFDITNFLKNLAQAAPNTVKPSGSASIPGLGDPLPVPPPPIPSDFQLPSSSPSSAPVPPPPMPPNMFDNFSQDSRERDDSWNTSLPAKFPTWRDTADSNWTRDNSDIQDGDEWTPVLPVPKVPPPPLPQNLETPESPPSFEKESFREPVEYDDTSANRNSLRNSDVDHRSFMGHTSTPKDVDHRLLNSRFKKDVDHRNLISLTGSPRELQPPPLPPNLWGDVDQDYRTPRQPPRPGDIVESVDMEMSDEEEIERHQDKGRSREQSPSKRLGSSIQNNPDSPTKDRDELGKSRSPHSSNSSKLSSQRYHVPPPSTRPPFPLPPRPIFADGQFTANRFDSPALVADFPARFSIPSIPPPPALPLSGPPPGIPLRGLNILPPNITMPPNRLLGIPNRSPVPAPLVPQRSLEMSPPPVIATTTSQQATPSGNSGTHSSGPEESDTDSIGQYLNMGLSDDEEIKEMVASMDPQLLQEVVDGINIGNGSEKIDLSSFMPNNGDAEESGETDWNGQTDFADPANRIGPLPAGMRPWKTSRPVIPGTPPGLSMAMPPMSPGAVRYRGHPPNWRSPPMHDRGRGRGWNFRQFRGRGPPGPPMSRQPFSGNW